MLKNSSLVIWAAGNGCSRKQCDAMDKPLHMEYTFRTDNIACVIRDGETPYVMGRSENCSSLLSRAIVLFAFA